MNKIEHKFEVKFKVTVTDYELEMLTAVLRRCEHTTPMTRTAIGWAWHALNQVEDSYRGRLKRWPPSIHEEIESRKDPGSMVIGPDHMGALKYMLDKSWEDRDQVPKDMDPSLYGFDVIEKMKKTIDDLIAEGESMVKQVGFGLAMIEARRD